MKTMERTRKETAWTRRRVLAAAGTGAAVALVTGAGADLWAAEKRAGCTLTPELEVGPYYLPYELLRQDIREGRPGVPLHMTIELRNVKTCAPVKDAAIDIWHCDALGVYSGFTKVDASRMGPPPERPGGPPPPRGIDDRGTPPPPDGFGPGGPGGPPPMQQTDQQTFLRGVQLTDDHGLVQFQTIYPGWYVGRDTHVHMEVHIGGHVLAGAGTASDAAHSRLGKYDAGHVCHIGQMSFPDELSDRIGKLDPYRQHKIERTRLDQDMVFHAEGREVMLDLQPVAAPALERGFRGRLVVFVDPDTTPKPVGPGGRGGPGGGSGGGPFGPPPRPLRGSAEGDRS